MYRFPVLACLLWWACKADKAIMFEHLRAQRNINHVKPGIYYFFSFNFGTKSLQPWRNLPGAIHCTLFHFPHRFSRHLFMNAVCFFFLLPLCLVFFTSFIFCLCAPCFTPTWPSPAVSSRFPSLSNLHSLIPDRQLCSLPLVQLYIAGVAC